MTKFFKILGLVLALSFGINAYGEETVPYLVFQARDDAGKMFKYQLDDDLLIKNTFENNQFRVTSSHYDELLKTSDFSSVGIGYFEAEKGKSDSLISIADDLDGDSSWQVVTLEGVVVGEGTSGAPDLSSLQQGKVYVVKIGKTSFKYYRLK